MKLHDLKMASLSGNDRAYGVTSVAEQADSPLKGKRIVFLGLSVTSGSTAMGVSFADYICAQNGAVMVKEAVSGTNWWTAAKIPMWLPEADGQEYARRPVCLPVLHQRRLDTVRCRRMEWHISSHGVRHRHGDGFGGAHRHMGSGDMGLSSGFPDQSPLCQRQI
jgi:hypothetical protein